MISNDVLMASSSFSKSKWNLSAEKEVAMIQSKTITIFNDTTSHFNHCPYLISFEFENDERVIETSFEVIINDF